MAKIVDYKKDLPILNRNLMRIDTHERKLTEHDATLRKLEERLKKLEHA